MDELTQAQWEDIQRTLGPAKANAWLAKRNRELAGELPPVNAAQQPVYQSPPLAVRPQGVPSVDETDDTEAPGSGSGALSSYESMTPETIYGMLNDTQKRINNLAPAMGQADYEAARQKLMERRFGPSRAEQLFALSAALAKPTYAGGRFGQIMGNVAPVLGDMEKSQREAAIARDNALETLRQQYLTGSNAAERQKLEAQLSVLRTAAQFAKPKSSGLSYDAQRGVFVDKGNPRPTSNVYYDPKTKLRLVQWQDGYWRKDNPDGTVSVFERYGDEFRPITGGAR